MLLRPQGNERRFNPMAQCAQPVDAGMAGGAQGNQPAALMEFRDDDGAPPSFRSDPQPRQRRPSRSKIASW